MKMRPIIALIGAAKNGWGCEMAQSDLLRVDCYDGKYTVIQEADGGVHALRYGEHWRNCVGDGLILGLAQDLADVRAERDALKARVEQLEEARRVDTLTTSHYVANVALKSLWDMLGASNQTEAFYKLREALQS
jgi:hypothetical protein